MQLPSADATVPGVRSEPSSCGAWRNLPNKSIFPRVATKGNWKLCMQPMFRHCGKQGTKRVSLSPCSHVDPCGDGTFLAYRSAIGPQWHFKGILQIAPSRTFSLLKGVLTIWIVSIFVFLILLLSVGNNAEVVLQKRGGVLWPHTWILVYSFIICVHFVSRNCPNKALS